MTRKTRIALLVAGVVVMVAAFVALRPSSDDEADRSATPPPKTTSTQPETPGSGREASDQPSEASGLPRKPREERPPLLRAGDAQTIKVTKGETVRFTARSERDDEVHVHGYDITRRAPAARTVSLSFPADIEGIFEIELEGSGEEIGKLEVRP